MTALTPDAWNRVRCAYLDGASVPEMCERFGVSRSQLYVHAAAGAWRRPDPAPEDDDPPFDPDAPLPSPGDLADQAFRRAAHAVARGRLREAQGWTRLLREFRRLALDAPPERGGERADDGPAHAPARPRDGTPGPAPSSVHPVAVEEKPAREPDRPDTSGAVPDRVPISQAQLSRRALRRLRGRG